MKRLKNVLNFIHEKIIPLINDKNTVMYISDLHGMVHVNRKY